MRQADWQTWLLEEPQREAAQILFSLHPEWEELATGTETGRLLLTIPSPTVDHAPLVIDCGIDIAIVTWEAAASQFPLSEVREAMRLSESILWEEAVVVSDFAQEKLIEARYCRLDTQIPASAPETSHRVISSWDGTYDQIIRFE